MRELKKKGTLWVIIPTIIKMVSELTTQTI